MARVIIVYQCNRYPVGRKLVSPRQVLVARIGIHHRMLFRADDSYLEVLDVVAREGLDLALKRLRNGVA